MEDAFLDAALDRRRELMRNPLIADYHFAAVAPDPPDAETERIESALRVLCGRLEHA
jgi:hypothetical protein